MIADTISDVDDIPLAATPFKHTGWALGLSIVLLGTAAAWVHSLLTYILMPPFVHPADDALWSMVWCAKIGATVALPLLVVRRTAMAVYGRPKRALLALAAFILPTLLLTYAANPLRPELGRIVNNYVHRYYPLSQVANPETYPGLDRFITHWHQGYFYFYELLTIAVPALIIVGAGYLKGNRPWLVMWLATPLTFVATLVIAGVTQVSVIDYDFFYGSTFLGPALSDLAILIGPSDGSTEFSLTIGLLLLTAGYALDWHWSRPPGTDHQSP